MADLRFPTKQVGQGICLFVLVCLAYGLIWEVPRRQVDGSRDRLTAKEAIDAETAARTGWSQLLVGSFVAFGAFTTWKNLQENQNKNRDDARNAERNFRALQEKQDRDAAHAEKNLQALLEKNTADRFSKAIEQLGNENIHVRLGGIFALEQIANTEDKYYWQIMEILTAYVRVRSPWPQKKAPQDSSDSASPMATQPEQEQKFPVVEIDIEAIMTVISRRRNTYLNEPNRLNLTKTDLQGLIAKAVADFEGIDFSEANLSCGKLKAVRLSQTLFKNTDITGVHFTEAVPKNLPAALKRIAQFRYDAKDLTLEQLSQVKGDSYEDAILPSYLEIDSDESQQKIKEFQNTVRIPF
jgi:Pentapeptide repeats (8 copies)